MDYEQESRQNEAGTIAPETDKALSEPAPEQPAEPGQKSKKKKKEKVKKTVGQEILSWVLTILAALAIAFVIRTFIFEPVRVDGASMNDTLVDGEIMYVSKLRYGTRWLVMPWADGATQEASAKWTYFGNPQRFDVVICRYPGRGGTNFVKRVVGLPGDTVELKSGVLYVNGEAYDEPYVSDAYRSGSLNTMSARRVPAKGDVVTVDEGAFLTYFTTGYTLNTMPSFLVNGTRAEDQPSLYGLVADFTAVCGQDVLAQVPTRNSSGEVVDCGFTYNGKALTTDGTMWYLDGEVQESCPLSGKEFVVDSDRYFLMGDHRNNSRDSRHVGAVPRSYIMGQVKQVLWPLGQFRPVVNGQDFKAPAAETTTENK